MKRILITGISGMIGSHLSAYLTEQGYEVSGISRSTSHSRLQNIKHYQGDILDKAFLKKVFTDYKPSVVYHLAAMAFNSKSWIAEDTCYLTNIQGSRNVFEACRDYSPNARVIPACSSAEYGYVGDPAKETDQLNPVSPYGVSKLAMEAMAYQFCLNYNMDIVLPRLFIHVGINHPPHTFIQNLCKQVSMVLALNQIRINCGILEPVRDYVDIRDGCKALLLLQKKGLSGNVYNICSGKGYSGYDVVDILSQYVGCPIFTQEQSEYIRPSDELRLVGDPYRINALGWSAKIPLQETIGWVFNNWIERIKK